MSKIVDNQTLSGIIKELKQKGRTVVFTNGAFDLIHVGHIRYLQGASDLADVTICALNSDESVRGLKGEGRPVLPLDERMEIVSTIECVDYVTSFSEPNVERLLLEFTPDIHAKGTDYTEETVPEVKIVRSYGGRVAITGDPKDHNTTDIIMKISENEKEGGG